MRRAFLCIAALAVSGGASFAATPSFQGLGALPGGDTFSMPVAISADGSVIVGRSPPTGSFRWTRAEGLKMITIGSDDATVIATDVSADGTASIGGVIIPRVGGAVFRYPDGAAVEYPMGEPGTPFHFGGVLAAEEHGALALQYYSDAGREAARWTPENGYEVIGDFGGGVFESTPEGISDDGQVIVGIGNDAVGPMGFRWTAEEGRVALTDSASGYSARLVNGISADGKVIVGNAHMERETSVPVPMRWTEELGIVPLTVKGSPPAGGAAWGVSGDGSRIVGTTDVGTFLWTETAGLVDLQALLVNRYGLDEELDGWLLGWPMAISDDGTTIAGLGVDAAGNSTGWVATIPEPSSVLLAAIGGVGLWVAQRRYVRR